MELEEAIASELVLHKTSPLGPIDPKRARFPCCVVWSPLPVISWLIPFIGHVGICREDGVILDFAGPNFVCVDHFTFGAVARYIQLDKEKCCCCCLSPSSSRGATQDDNHKQTKHEEEMNCWDHALRKSTQEFQHRSYNLFTCNCHSFVANNLNRLSYDGRKRWNVVNLAAWIFLKGTWVNNVAVMRSIVPFAVVFCLGLLLGGSYFLLGLVLFSTSLVVWFLMGTYCFKNLIQL